MAHLYITSFNTNPNIGLYMFCNNSFCLVGNEVPENQIPKIEEVLGVPVHRINIAGTSLVGAFVTGNDKMILVPDIIRDDERDELKRLKIPFKIISTKLTALGNNIFINNTACIVNPEYSAGDITELKKLTGLPVYATSISDGETPGALIVANSKTGVIHNDATENEIKTISKMIGIKLSNATINFGVSYLKSGLVCNDHGFIVSEKSGGPEIAFIDEFMGYAEKD